MNTIVDLTKKKNTKSIEIWIEKYRPTTLSEFIGNVHIKDSFEKYIKTNDPPHILLYGRAGTGKTTLAKILLNNLDADYLYINASDYSGIDVVREKIRPYCQSAGFKGLKLVILDEADGLTPTAQASLRNIMETYIKHVRFILTCNYVEKIIEPIVSRNSTGLFEVYPPSKKECAILAKEILDKESITYTLEAIATIVNSKFPDIRSIVGTLQKFSIDGKLDINEDVENSDLKMQFLKLITTQGKPLDIFREIRQLFADNKIRDFTDFYRIMYDNIDDIAPGKVADSILTIADYQSKDALVVDKEIPFMALIIDIINIKYSK